MNDLAADLQIITGACGHDCPDTCSWLVEVKDGRATSLRGNPEHPMTQGHLCGKVNHYLERVYHPDRVLYPLKRCGPKGSGAFTRVSWDEALHDVAHRWQQLIQEYGPTSILPYSSAGNQGLIQMSSLDRRLANLMGFCQLERNICGEVAGIGLSATLGAGYGIDPEDIVHSRLVVLWGTNTIVTNLHYWPLVLEARRRGAKIIVIDPIRTKTAEQADCHLAPRPGSDAALALGIMHILVREGWIDQDYIDRHTEGFEQLKQRLLEYPVERVSQITQLSIEEIEAFARDYGTTRPTLIRPLLGLEHHHNGAMVYRNLACLPLLTGAWRERGGGLFRSSGALQYSLLNYAKIVRTDLIPPGTRTLNMRDLGVDLCSQQLAPPIKSLLVYNVNPVVSIPNAGKIVEGLLREELFTVVHDLFVTETARYADYIFPATSQIESVDLMPAWGHHYLALNRPAIAPQGESVCNTEFFRRLAKAMGRTEEYLYESDESLIRLALSKGHPWLEGVSLESLWEEGFVRLKNPDDWRPYANGGFPTASGKALLWSDELKRMDQDPLPAPGAIRVGEPDELQLITGKTLHYLNSSYAHVDHHRNREGLMYIEVCEEDATKRGLLDGELVRVSNDQGELLAECRVSKRVRAGVAWMPFGGIGDRSGSDRSVNLLTPEEPTDWGGGSGFYDAFVRVAKA